MVFQLTSLPLILDDWVVSSEWGMFLTKFYMKHIEEVIYMYSPPPPPPPLYRHLWGNSPLALYRGWRYIEVWHSNEICSADGDDEG